MSLLNESSFTQRKYTFLPVIPAPPLTLPRTAPRTAYYPVLAPPIRTPNPTSIHPPFPCVRISAIHFHLFNPLPLYQHGVLNLTKSDHPTDTESPFTWVRLVMSSLRELPPLSVSTFRTSRMLSCSHTCLVRANAASCWYFFNFKVVLFKLIIVFILCNYVFLLYNCFWWSLQE